MAMLSRLGKKLFESVFTVSCFGRGTGPESRLLSTAGHPAFRIIMKHWTKVWFFQVKVKMPAVT